MAEKKHVIEYIDIIKSFEKVKEKLKNKSDKGHQHGNADITDIDASKIKSGTIDIDRLPKGAIERMVYVKDDAARFALTANTAQNGDTVKVTSTKKMFYVIDDTKLSSEAGYEPYTAESASAVPWSGVTGKPTTFTPEAHTHAISEVADLQETLTGLRQDVNAKPSKDTNTTYSLIQDSTDGHKLTFKGSDGSTKTVTIPDNDHNTWRDVVDSLDSTRTDASLSANQGRVLNGKIDGIEIGGRNLILNSYDKYSNCSFLGDGNSFDIITTTCPDQTYGKVARITTNASAYNNILRIRDVVRTNDTYTLSVWCKSAESTDVYGVEIDICDHGKSFTATTSWQKQTLTATITNQSSVYQFVDFEVPNGHSVLFWHPKLEKGNKATDWTPAPEDLVNEVSNNYLPLHGTADTAASITDYGDTAKHIQVGFSGAGITGDDIKYIAGYTSGDGGNLSAKIKDISKDALKSWLGLGSRAYDSTSYLPLSGGEMSGDIIFNGYGTSTIGTGSKDGAGLDAKNNLNIASWYGVSFTSKCAGFAYSDKPGVSIDCRNGTLAVAGAIYANGGVVGDLTGNAKTATTANSANSAKYINYSTNKYVTGDSMKTPYWRFATIEVSSDWYDQTAVLLVNSGCIGGGFGIIKLSVRSNQLSNTENAYCEFSWLIRRGFDPNQFIVKGYSTSKTTNYFDVYYKATGGYQGLTVTVLSSGSRGDISFDWKLTNDDPRAAMDLRKYNYELISSDEGVAYYASTANHLYNTQGDGSKNSMNFYWMGKDGQPTWLWGGTDGSNMYVYNPSNFSVNYANSAGSADKLAGFYSKDSSQTWGNQIGTFISGMGDSTGGSLAFRRDNPTAGQLSAIIDGYWYQNEGRFMCLDTNNYSSYALPLSGGTITGRIRKQTEGSWIGDRDRAVVYSATPADDSYGCVACMPTKHGSWTMGNLGGVEHLIFNYVPDANYSANKNESIHVYLRPTEGTIALTSDIPTSLPASDVYAWAKASSKPSYSWGEISGRPTALSSFTNDSGFITGSDSRLTNARPASDVYSWAKASSKPSYTASEVGAAAVYDVKEVIPMNSGTSHEIQTDYSSAIIRIGNLCMAMCGITGTIYPRTWYPVAQIPTPNNSKTYFPTKQTNTIICGISGSDHMEAIIDTKGIIKVWWSGSSPVTSANFCIPYYIK